MAALSLSRSHARPQEITTDQYITNATERWVAEIFEDVLRPQVTAIFAKQGLVGDFAGTVEVQLDMNAAPSDWVAFLEQARKSNFAPVIQFVEQEGGPITLIAKGDQLPPPQMHAIWQGGFTVQVPLPPPEDYQFAGIRADAASVIVKKLNQWFSQKGVDPCPVFMVNTNSTWTQWYWSDEERAQGYKITPKTVLTIESSSEADGKLGVIVSAPHYLSTFPQVLIPGIVAKSAFESRTCCLVEISSPIGFGPVLDDPRMGQFNDMLTRVYKETGVQGKTGRIFSFGNSDADELRKVIHSFLVEAKIDRQPTLSSEGNAALGLGGAYVENARKEAEKRKAQKENQGKTPDVRLRQLIASWGDPDRQVPKPVMLMGQNDLAPIAILLKNEAKWPEAGRRMQTVIEALSVEHSQYAGEVRNIFQSLNLQVEQ